MLNDMQQAGLCTLQRHTSGDPVPADDISQPSICRASSLDGAWLKTTKSCAFEGTNSENIILWHSNNRTNSPRASPPQIVSLGESFTYVFPGIGVASFYLPVIIEQSEEFQDAKTVLQPNTDPTFKRIFQRSRGCLQNRLNFHKITSQKYSQSVQAGPRRSVYGD
jgi:hypothetical protein